jgi:hypothetical protein
MESAVYHERGFSTVDMKFAILCLIFGSKLRQHLPLEWNDIYPSLDAYLENLQDPRRSPPRIRISFNFELVSLPNEVLVAWRIQGDALISSLMSNGAREAILAAHEHLRELIVLLRDNRPHAKWETIKGNGAGESVILGKRSSPELQAEFLGKL